jgi:hypothetical protein
VGGVTQLFLDGVLVWKTVRAPNTRIPPDGTLVIGREQDCRGVFVAQFWYRCSADKPSLVP